ncbi:MAG: coiled-coil domain-containing protein, partial [Candidatus Helarchaeota archaeon]
GKVIDKLTKIEMLPSLSELKKELDYLAFKIDLTNLEKEEKRIGQRIKDIEKKLTIAENEKQKKKNNITKLGKEIDSLREKILKMAEEKRFGDPKDWISYVLSHKQKLDNLIDIIDQMKSTIDSCRVDLENIIAGKPIRNKEISDIIKKIYQDIFLKTYNQPEYFKHVFKEYEEILGFDISKKTLRLKLKNGQIEDRSLDDFSSGEKAYAFIRAMMSISLKSNFKIIVLDESNALLDFIRSGSLYDFQKELIESGNVNKIINILPVKEDLSQVLIEKKEALENARVANDKDNILKLESEIKKLTELNEEYKKFHYYQEVILS